MNVNATQGVRFGLAVAAIAGAAVLTAGCATTSGSLADQIQPVAAHSIVKPDPANADKISEITATIINNTDLTLTKVSDSHTGTGVHWQQQPPGTIAPHSVTTITDYAGGNNKIDMTYQDSTGATYSFEVNDPFGSYDTISDSTTSTSYGTSGSSGSGYDDKSSFAIYAGHSYGYSGSAEQYVVPAGVTQMQVDVTGGSGGETDGATINGADISGTLAVTPGEVLTIGVGGEGGPGEVNYAGGWGLPWNGSSFSGGAGLHGSHSTPGDQEWSGGGGGASVIATGNQLLVVAGGGGGGGTADGYVYNGGRGGDNGSLTGQNGQGDGGTAGSQSQPAGQNSSPSADEPSGAGGGGYAGGGTGQGVIGGGGAGSSYDGGLTGTTVTTASGSAIPGHINLTAVTS